MLTASTSQAVELRAAKNTETNINNKKCFITELEQIITWCAFLSGRVPVRNTSHYLNVWWDTFKCLAWTFTAWCDLWFMSWQLIKCKNLYTNAILVHEKVVFVFPSSCLTALAQNISLYKADKDHNFTGGFQYIAEREKDDEQISVHDCHLEEEGRPNAWTSKSWLLESLHLGKITGEDCICLFDTFKVFSHCLLQLFSVFMTSTCWSDQLQANTALICSSLTHSLNSDANLTLLSESLMLVENIDVKMSTWGINRRLKMKTILNYKLNCKQLQKVILTSCHFFNWHIHCMCVSQRHFILYFSVVLT